MESTLQGDEENLLLNENEIKEEKNKAKSWVKIVLFVLLFLIVLALTFYFWWIPLIIESILANAPPVKVNHIGFNRIHSNDTLSLDLQAELDLKAVPATFYESDYILSIRGPQQIMQHYFTQLKNPKGYETQALGNIKISPFQLGWTHISLNLDGYLFHSDIHALQSLFRMVLNGLVERITSNYDFIALRNHSVHAQDHHLTTGYSIVVEGRPNANILGVFFKALKMGYNLPLIFNTTNIFHLMNISAEQGLPQTTEDLLILNFDVSFLNPLPISFNLGKLELDVHWLKNSTDTTVLMTIQIPNLQLEFTQKSSKIQKRDAKILIKQDYVPILVDMWEKKNEINFGINGNHFRFLGYPEENGERIFWIEKLFHQVDIQISAKNPN